MKKQLNEDNRAYLLEILKESSQELSTLNFKISNELSRIKDIEDNTKISKEDKERYIFNAEISLLNMNINIEMTEKRIKRIKQIIIENEY